MSLIPARSGHLVSMPTSVGARRPAPDPLLTAAEEVHLARQIEAGVLAADMMSAGRSIHGATAAELRQLVELGDQARQRFVRANLRLVGMVAGRAAMRSRLAESDLFQEGCLGLLLAVQRFDHARGHRFSTYALCWIRAYVGAASATGLGALNLPANRAEKLRAALGLEAELTQTLGRRPSTSELAAVLGKSPRWTAELLAYQPPGALELLDTDAGGYVDDYDLDSMLSIGTSAQGLLRRLSGVERTVLEWRLGFTDGRAHSYADTARALGLTVSRVRRAEQRGLERLRSWCLTETRLHLSA